MIAYLGRSHADGVVALHVLVQPPVGTVPAPRVPVRLELLHLRPSVGRHDTPDDCGRGAAGCAGGRRTGSATQPSGLCSRVPTGQGLRASLECPVTTAWQLARLPSSSQPCRCTPTECFPCLGSFAPSKLSTRCGESVQPQQGVRPVAYAALPWDHVSEPRQVRLERGAGLGAEPQRPRQPARRLAPGRPAAPPLQVADAPTGATLRRGAASEVGGRSPRRSRLCRTIGSAAPGLISL
jgi:hypothetical protein